MYFGMKEKSTTTTLKAVYGIVGLNTPCVSYFFWIAGITSVNIVHE